MSFKDNPPTINYKYNKKDVKIDGKLYEGYFPDEHSTLKGLVHNVVNHNPFNPIYGGGEIPVYYTKCFILEAGEDEWKSHYDGPSMEFNVNGKVLGKDKGIFSILFQFEAREIREDFYKKWEIYDLNKRITQDTNRLKELIE